MRQGTIHALALHKFVRDYFMKEKYFTLGVRSAEEGTPDTLCTNLAYRQLEIELRS
jgi:hypothetical protein